MKYLILLACVFPSAIFASPSDKEKIDCQRLEAGWQVIDLETGLFTEDGFFANKATCLTSVEKMKNGWVCAAHKSGGTVIYSTALRTTLLNSTVFAKLEDCLRSVEGSSLRYVCSANHSSYMIFDLKQRLYLDRNFSNIGVCIRTASNLPQ